MAEQKIPGDDAIAGDLLLRHPEVMGLVHDEPVDLHERPGIQEQVEALARRLLARLVLPPDALLSARQLGPSVAPVQLVEAFLERHQAPALTLVEGKLRHPATNPRDYRDHLLTKSMNLLTFEGRSDDNSGPCNSGRRRSSWYACSPSRWRSFPCWWPCGGPPSRSGEHTSELQSLAYLVCRLLL